MKLKSVLTIAVFSLFIAGSLNAEERGRVTTIVSDLPAAGGLAVDDTGNIYASDMAGRSTPGEEPGTTVLRITPGGKVEPFTSEVYTPTGLAIGPDGDLYVSNAHTGQIKRVTPDGGTSVFTENVTWPGGLDFDRQGNLYTPKCFNQDQSERGHSIYRITPAGEATVYLTSPLLECSVGLVFDDEGNLYTANWFGRNILKFTPDREVSVLATIPGKEGDAIAHMTYARGRLYVAGYSTQRIWEVTLDGKVSILAGSGQQGSADGVGTAASFNYPNGIAVSDSGNAILVMDVAGGAARIRRVELGD